MLAQNFKSPTDLGISDDEHAALIKVLGMMERGELVDTDEFNPAATDFGFYIGCAFMQHSCGTVACIGGWAAMIMRHPDPYGYVNKYIGGGALRDLYWRYPVGARLDDAAIGLRNFLTEGSPNWPDKIR